MGDDKDPYGHFSMLIMSSSSLTQNVQRLFVQGLAYRQHRRGENEFNTSVHGSVDSLFNDKPSSSFAYQEDTFSEVTDDSWGVDWKTRLLKISGKTVKMQV